MSPYCGWQLRREDLCNEASCAVHAVREQELRNRYGVVLLCIEPTYDIEAIRGAAATHPTICSLPYCLEQVANIVCPYMQTRDGGDLACGAGNGQLL